MNETTVVTPENIEQFVVRGSWDIQSSIKADNDATTGKTVTLRFEFNGDPLTAVMARSLADARVTWANSKWGRANIVNIRNASVITVQFKSPAKKPETREQKIQDNLAIFLKAGVDEDTALEMATKVVDNPEIVPARS